MPGKMMMYREGGKVKKMPSAAESVASGNRMSAMEAAEERAMRRRDTMPSIADTIASGNRASRLNAEDMRGVRMIDEGPMSPVDMQAMRMYGKKGTKR
jgi:L-asparaginase/Glu-tRNA(Gln) amidotransferase subunit D